MKNQLIIKAFALTAFFIFLTAFILPINNGYKDLPTEKFNKVSVALKSKVYITQGQEYKLDIQANDETLKKIKVEFSSDELSIECKLGCKINELVIINITAPSLIAISIAGSANLFIEKSYETKNLDLSIAGGGSMDMNNLLVERVSARVAGSGKLAMNDLAARKVSASIAGSGDIKLFGSKSGNYEDFSIAGSGNIDAAGFESEVVKVEIAGSGNCKVFASEKLEASIAGSGDIQYKGSPEVEKETAGSGKIIKMDVDKE